MAANVKINDNNKYVELNELGVGDYFILSGELYIIIGDYYSCCNLSTSECCDLDCDLKVILVPDEKIKINVDI